MGRSGIIRIGVLTSSRADYGIYIPLLKKLQSDNSFQTTVIAFASHLDERYGNTVYQIILDGFTIIKVPDTAPYSDSPDAIAISIGKTTEAFASFFNNNRFDLIIALGDRYEMFAAVVASVPFNIPVAHIHGGETTLGAIDNFFRNSITHCSKFHFTTTEKYMNRVIELLGTEEGVYNVGALSIDNLKNTKLPGIKDFYDKYGIDLNNPTILFTFHPETVDYSKNEFYIIQILEALKQIKSYQLIITMPNADTMGLVIRAKLKEFGFNRPKTWLIESLGPSYYLTAMQYCSLILGNSSSGFVEAAYFPKRVINLGNRQKGRIETQNILSIEIESDKILEAISRMEKVILPESCNIYGDGNAAQKITNILKRCLV